MSRKSKAAEFVNESYNIDIIGRNVLVSDAMKDYALEKVSKVERFMHRIIDISVVMEVQKQNHSCDIVIKADHIKIKSHATTDNMYATIDKAFDKIESQILRYKSRIQDHHAKPLEMVDINVNVLKAPEIELLEVNDDIEEENLAKAVSNYRPHEVLKKEKMSLKFLTNEEAVMKMELSGDAFLIYLSESDRKIKVMHRRDDGHFAIIEPES
jgi:putative sigma-54 modulation protein